MYHFCKIFLPLGNVPAQVFDKETEEKTQNGIKDIHFFILISLLLWDFEKICAINAGRT